MLHELFNLQILFIGKIFLMVNAEMVISNR
jgi:hypothetical protein